MRIEPKPEPRQPENISQDQAARPMPLPNQQVVYKVLHKNDLTIDRVLTSTCQACIFVGTLKPEFEMSEADKQFLGNIRQVVLKQFSLKKLKKSFKKDLKILKKIKALHLKDNAGFPYILSAKISQNYGEILMTYSGQDIYGQFNLQNCMESNMKFAGTTFDRVCQIGMQLLFQLEVLHFLGYVHGDLKLQNIAFNAQLNRYTITDFTSVSKIFHKNGVHKEIGKNENFCSNIMFASESMVNQITVSRRDDLESLMLLVCYLKSGTLPVVEYINANLDHIDISKFIDDVLEYRIKNFKESQEQIKELLGERLQSAYIYTTGLVYNQKPDYKLLKLLIAQTELDEQQIIDEQQEMKRVGQKFKQLMYNDVQRQQPFHFRGRRMEERKVEKEEEPEFEFEENMNEFQKNEHDIEFYCRRVDNDRVRKNKLRHIILNHNKLQPEIRSQDSQSSNNPVSGSHAPSSDSMVQKDQIEQQIFVNQNQVFLRDNSAQKAPKSMLPQNIRDGLGRILNLG